MKRHERIHTGEKPHFCTFCNMKFSQIGSKIRHERIHTGEKPYACNYCERKFNTNSGKICHENIHKALFVKDILK